MDRTPQPLLRLRRALELYRVHVGSGGTDVEGLLERGDDVRDLLDVLLRSGDGAGGTPTGEDPPLPARIGEFRLLRRIGRGGMGEVFEAEQASLGRRVALKLLAPERFDARGLARFGREALVGGRLDHPGIVAVHACGEDGGRPWIAMELVPGGRTLADLVEEARRRAGLERAYYRDVAALFAEVADALARAHAAGVVHRDVKPANILLGPGGRPKLADFGLARLADSFSLSRTGATPGTPFYMSPEQAAGEGEVGPASDQFSLGATLYEALTLRRPFEGDSTERVLRSVREDEPPDPSRLHAGLPRGLAAIALKALAKEPAHRYPDLGALADDLRRFLAHRPIVARPPGPIDRARGFVRRHRALSLGALAVALALGAALAATSLALGRAWAAEGRLARERDTALDLGGAALLRELEARADELWPATPRRAPAMGDWLADARLVVDELPRHRARLAVLRGDPSFAGGAEGSDRGRDVEQAAFVRELERFAGPGGTFEQVRARLEFASTLRARSVEDFAGRWDEVRAAIAASPRYGAGPDGSGGLVLEPQVGLVPLGADPESGLQEFAVHALSGTLPERDPHSGALVLGDDTGIVLVLLPGGTFWMGAQARDPEGPNYDPRARWYEGPPRRVALDPFFISKYELTQAQYTALMGSNPSFWPMGAVHEGTFVSGRFPVEHLTFDEAWAFCRRLELALPTEAQWEYAARGGTGSPWSFGDDPSTAAGFEDLSRPFASYLETHELAHVLATGNHHRVHAPVGTFRPNPFGLHEIFGNVRTWCADVFAPGYHGLALRAGDGLVLGALDEGHRSLRGGTTWSGWFEARASMRVDSLKPLRNRQSGLRPVRALERGAGDGE